MLKILPGLKLEAFARSLRSFWELSGAKIDALQASWPAGHGAPVITVRGRYTARKWTEWTLGFHWGAALLQFGATGESRFLKRAWRRIRLDLVPLLTHFGVHDHGFNIISTYGQILRLMNEHRISGAEADYHECVLALKVSGAVQAHRWTPLSDGDGYIYSFHGPHSLFADTMRSLRSLAVSHHLGHGLQEDNDRPVNLLDRLIRHARTTARYNVYYGEGRDAYDVRGRVAHESIFNAVNGAYRCPNSQQGFSPFTTWMRGLAWILCGYAEQLEFLGALPPKLFKPYGGWNTVETWMLKAACAAADFYIENTPADGIPYWDSGAPGLSRMRRYLDRPADPFNRYEPVDSSAATIAAQGLLRLGHYLMNRMASPPEKASRAEGRRYWQAGLTVLHSLLHEPYLSRSKRHQGLILHAVYHRPNGWDYIPRGRKVPCGESSMWGDYHIREAVLYVQRLVERRPYLTFWSNPNEDAKTQEERSVGS